MRQRLEVLEQERVELRQSVSLLQQRMGQDTDRDREAIIRVSQLEDVVEKIRSESKGDVQEAYQNLGRAWDSITELMHSKKLAESHLRHINDRLQDLDTKVAHIGERQLELVDMDISLEGRIEDLEELGDRVEALEDVVKLEEKDTLSTMNNGSHASHAKAIASRTSASVPPAVIAVRTAARNFQQASSDELWTVHVSLMPSSTLPFPFERDTNAYKRCLSRGLHQMIAVNGTSAEAFEKAINKAFGHILRGRKWAPLQAQPCTAKSLAGLPMIRPLDPSLIDERCDLEFLRKCAVCNPSGTIDSLYIAMRDKTLSWHSIRRLPVYLEGLEPCWGFDMLLDANDPFVDEENENDVNSSEDEVMGGIPRPSAGDIVATLPSLKRAASEMSRSSSFGSATVPTSAAGAPTSAAAATAATVSAAEIEGSRPKVPRLYPLPNIVEVRRGVKTL
ncbi:MAG: hypothetical protein STHCBS139747_001962 [Sporothrix thermara]